MKKHLRAILYPVLGVLCVIGITLAVPFFILLEADQKKEGSDCNPNGPDPETKGD